MPCDVPCDVEMRCRTSGLLKYTLTEDTVSASEQCVSQTLFSTNLARHACQVPCKTFNVLHPFFAVVLQQFWNMNHLESHICRLQLAIIQLNHFARSSSKGGHMMWCSRKVRSPAPARHREPDQHHHHHRTAQNGPAPPPTLHHWIICFCSLCCLTSNWW